MSHEMSKYNKLLHKKRAINHPDYIKILNEFKESDKLAFIPEQQRDGNRYNWHEEASKLGLITITMKIKRFIRLCGAHHKPIISIKPSTNIEYGLHDSDYECDYDDKYRYNLGDGDFLYETCRLGKATYPKIRTVVILKDIIKDKTHNLREFKLYLVEIGILTKEENGSIMFE